ncbi:MAG: glycosyltransferase family 2 protein [Treponema sp.]|jgi:glycosyltransferase involved in cell wall biosynthesis|nr:glycosyltransferase family 2 protein [Treponema sp.]
MIESLISVIIPCRNGTNYLAEVVASVKKQNMNVEIIIVDDGSTDGTAKTARSLGCKTVSIPHSGLSAARNEGIKNASGDFIMFLDHDDIMNEGALDLLYQELKNEPEAMLVEAMLEDFISPELDNESKSRLVSRPESYYGLLTGAVLFRREVFEHIGGFDEKLETGQGVDFMLRIKAKEIKTKRLDFVSCRRRLHNTNMGRTLQKEENRDYSTLLREKLRKIRS